jgi:ABC-type uncharacterized transport system auxiliary subunit
MKPLTRSSLLIVPALALCLVGCKRTTQVDATQPLQQSFQTAAPEVQQVIATVNNSLKANDYAQATKALAPLVTQRVLTDPQKQAVGVALQQINQAIAANPALDTKEMYQLREQMFRAVHSGPRF